MWKVLITFNIRATERINLLLKYGKVTNCLLVFVESNLI